MSGIIEQSLEYLQVKITNDGYEYLKYKLQPIYDKICHIQTYNQICERMNCPGELGKHIITEAIKAQTLNKPVGCAVVEYLCTEILDVASHKYSTKYIQANHIREAILSDPELNQIFK